MTSAAPSASERAARKWQRRSRNPLARFQQYASLHAPLAWRLRLDLVVLIHAGLGFLAAFLMLWLLPAMLQAQDYGSDVELDTAQLMLFSFEGGAALAGGALWAYSVTKTKRLREIHRYGQQPGLVAAMIICMSFAAWSLFVAVAPHANAERTGGGTILSDATERLRERSNTIDGDLEDELSKVEARAQRASLIGAVLARQINENAATALNNALQKFSRATNKAPRGIRFSADSFEITAEDAKLADAFARSPAFDRAVIETLLVDGVMDEINGLTVDRDRFPAAWFDRSLAGSSVRDYGDWYEQSRAHLLASPTFAALRAEAEAAIWPRIDGPTLSPEAWEELREARLILFVRYETQRADPRTYVSTEDRNLLRGRWQAVEASRQLRFLEVMTDQWNDAVLDAALRAGLFDSQVRETSAHDRLADVFRAKLAQSTNQRDIALQSQLLKGFTRVLIPVAWGAALLIALLCATTIRAGLGFSLLAPVLAVGAAVLASIAVVFVNQFVPNVNNIDIAPNLGLPAFAFYATYALAGIIAPLALLVRSCFTKNSSSLTALAALVLIWSTLFAVGTPTAFMQDRWIESFPNPLLAWTTFGFALTLLVTIVGAIILAVLARASQRPRLR